MLEKFKKRNNQSKRFYEREIWSKYIDDSFKENEILDKLKPVIAEIKEWEKKLVDITHINHLKRHCSGQPNDNH